MIVIKRVYEESAKTDGYRILVDRLWPRGLSKKAAKVDLWLQEIAPTDELRKWFNHEESKWKEFKTRYIHELQNNQTLIEQLHEYEKIFNNYASVWRQRYRA